MSIPATKIGLLGGASLLLALAGCGGGPFEGYMSTGCDHFRDAVATQGVDDQALKDALRRGGAFDQPALDEYGGSEEKLAQIQTLRAGYDALGHVVWQGPFDEPSRPLTRADHQDVDAAIAMCEENY